MLEDREIDDINDVALDLTSDASAESSKTLFSVKDKHVSDAADVIFCRTQI